MANIIKGSVLKIMLEVKVKKNYGPLSDFIKLLKHDDISLENCLIHWS